MLISPISEISRYMYCVFFSFKKIFVLPETNRKQDQGIYTFLVALTVFQTFLLPSLVNTSTALKQMTKFLSANFQKKVKSKLYHIEDSKTKGQTE